MIQGCATVLNIFTRRSADADAVLNSSRDDRALMRVRTLRGLTRISREACCRVIGIKMANGAHRSKPWQILDCSRATRRIVPTSFRRFRGRARLHTAEKFSTVEKKKREIERTRKQQTRMTDRYGMERLFKSRMIRNRYALVRDPLDETVTIR